MINLRSLVSVWDQPEFDERFKQAIRTAGGSQLPLQSALRSSSYALDDPLDVVVINRHIEGNRLLVKAGIFFSGVIAGCNCADDPTPTETQPEYCVVLFDIDRSSGEVRVSLVDETPP